MEQIHFRYQHYWMRALSLIPLIMILPLLEYGLLTALHINLPSIAFYVITVLIMYAFVNLCYPLAAGLFLDAGDLTLEGDTAVFQFKTQTVRIPCGSIAEISCDSVRLYRAALCRLTVVYQENSQMKDFKLFSEDLGTDCMQTTDVYRIYQLLLPHTNIQKNL